MRLDLPDDKRFTHATRLSIRWGDMDAMGHVNNAVYFRYLEQVRVEWFDRLGCTPDPRGCGPVIVNAFCNFIRQLEFPGEVLARHYVCNPGRSSFNTYILLSRSDDPDTLYAEGGAKTVWTDFKAQKSAAMPDWLRALVS